MSLLPDSASFCEKVQAFFLACRGDGVSLSDRDARLLASWEETGVPPEVVIQGIRESLSGHVFGGKVVSRPRSLSSCRKEVEAKIQRHLAASAGAARPEGNEAQRAQDGEVLPSPDGPGAISPAPAGSRGLLPGQDISAPDFRAPAHPLQENRADTSSAGQAPSTVQDMGSEAKRYALQRLGRAEERIRRLEADGVFSPWEIGFLRRQIRSGGTHPEAMSEAMLRFDDAAAIFSLRHLGPDARRRAIREARRAVGPRRRLESAFSHAVALHRSLVAIARRASGESDG